jgi:hemolysin III
MNPGKPRLRGVSHLVAFGVSLLTGPLLVVAAPTLSARVAVGVYGLCLSGLFGVSALYHRPTWSPTWRAWLRRLDHAAIFLAISGTYTAVAVLTLPPEQTRLLLTLVWCGALAGAALQFVGKGATRWLAAGPYLVLGWAGVALLPQLFDRLGSIGFGLVLAGALLYSLGAVVYARRRPDPRPSVFGYHEVFHLLVITAAAAHYAAVAGLVLPPL